MNRIFRFAALLLLILPFLFISCETDVDINADWQETTIVYGLFNQQDSVHYLRINKAYLGGNALEVAKIADSSSYMGMLDVKLIGINVIDTVQTIVFDTVTISNKDTGEFYNPYMLVYKATATLNPDYRYFLKISNTISGVEVTGETNLIKDFPISKPPSGGKQNFLRDYNTTIEWDNAVNAKIYEVYLRFNYSEVASGSTDTIHKFIDWPLGSRNAENISGNGTQTVDFANNGFYDFITDDVKPTQFNGLRLARNIDYIVVAGGVEYDTYLRVNGPSYSLVQDRPEYTNIQNGFGLISSRFAVVKNRQLSPLTEDEIILLGLQFVKNPDL
jgi:hypothetical protein